MEPVLIPIVILMVVLIPLALRWRFRRSKELLGRWAKTNGFDILAWERRWFFKGPFFVRSSNDQMIFHVTVENAEGKIRSGYVRVGGWFRGLFSDQISVRWDGD